MRKLSFLLTFSVVLAACSTSQNTVTATEEVPAKENKDALPVPTDTEPEILYNPDPADLPDLDAPVRADSTLETYEYVDEMPRFKGNLDTYIAENMRYPAAAKNAGIEGSVFISFTVTTDGSVRGVTVTKGIHPELDKEAIRIFNSMPAGSWYTGRRNGAPTDMKMTSRVRFELPE